MPLSLPRPISPTDARAYRAAGWWLDLTLTDLLRRQVRARPTAPAVIGPDRTLTFAELDAESDRVAAGLARLGVGRGEVVACQLGNVPEFLILHHAVAKRRAILNPIHLPYRAAEVEGILRFGGSRLVVVGPPHRNFSFLEMIEGLRPRLPALRHVATVGGERGAGAVAFADLREAPAGPAPETAGPEAPAPDDPFLLLFTSGTTASPKAALHTHNLRLGNARYVAEDLGVTAEDVFLSIARLSHMWGLMCYWVALWAGAPHALLDPFSPGGFATTVRRTRATVAVGAPAHAAAILAHTGREPTDLASLRLFALSGNVCPRALAREVRVTLGATPLMLWGMTETGAGLYTRPMDPPDVVEETVGRASGGCVLTVLDDAGRPLPTGTEGELVLRSPFTFEGYADNPEATRESFTPGGEFRTGDLASIDADGNVRILGRRKEQINRGGVKFHPADVEDVLLRDGRVAMVALVGMPDPGLGERACCVLVPRPGQPLPTLPDLTAILEDAGVAKFKWPERLALTDALPLTPTGKVQRATLRDWVRRRIAAEPDPASLGIEATATNMVANEARKRDGAQ